MVIARKKWSYMPGDLDYGNCREQLKENDNKIMINKPTENNKKWSYRQNDGDSKTVARIMDSSEEIIT